MSIPIFRMEGDGIRIVVSTPTDQDALPTVRGGVTAKQILCQLEADTTVGEAGSQGVLLRLGNSAITVTTTTGLYLSRGESVVLDCAGYTHIANIRVGGFDEILHVIPLR